MSGMFPGVDPYIEAQGFWPDFHARFMTYLCDVLAENLPSNYEARIDGRVNLVELPAEILKRIKPDLALRKSSYTATREVGRSTERPLDYRGNLGLSDGQAQKVADATTT
jgi:hypothetical protein